VETQRALQQGLLHLFATERSAGLRSKITDAVAAMASRIAGVTGALPLIARGLQQDGAPVKPAEPVPEEQQAKWDELMPAVMQMAEANQPDMRQSLLDLLDKSVG
jgi:hypothetical protein